jgi:hypothetical protein
MKKYILSIFAVVLAVGMVAFTAPEKTNFAATHVFEFNSTNGYEDQDVADITKWEYEGETSEVLLCNGQPTKACKIVLSDEDVDQSVSPMRIKNTVVITPQESSIDQNYVEDLLTSGPKSISNRF